ncbi:MAG TPA: HPF/RaiA family ribosome-associated protein [Stellaceae bacterium]|nr:HPF/RaiA family ribosome-associated protein [Stellaceae bacterium]
MTVPLQITFRDLPSSTAVEAQIRERAEGLSRIFDRLQSCRVIVEGRHRPQRAGKVFHLRLELTVPGRMIAVGQGPAELHPHDDVFVAVRAAFDAARRQLDHHFDRLRDTAKAHRVPTPVE